MVIKAYLLWAYLFSLMNNPSLPLKQEFHKLVIF